MSSGKNSQILLLVIFCCALTSLVGLSTKGIQTWDEGTYYTEARFVYQTTRAVTYLALGKLLPDAGYPSFDTLKETVTGLAPSMGRPVNTLVNTVGLFVFGEQPWVPALMSVLEGLGCVWLVFLIMRRLLSERAGLLAALLLTLSAYFLPYRRLGMCEAGGALAAVFTLWSLLRMSSDVAGGLARRHSWWLGMLCGLSFGMNTRTLLLLPVMVVWRAWQGRGPGGADTNAARPAADHWLLHGLRVAGGFAVMIALYQAPYLLIAPFAGRLGYQFQDYLGQMQRFITAQSELGRVGLAAAYGAPAYFFVRNEGPTVAYFALGLAYVWRHRRSELALLPALLVLPLLQTAVLIPYARYQSWLLPIFAMIGAAGLEGLCRGAQRRSPLLATALLVAALVVGAGYSGYRGLPVLLARSQHEAALEWCHAQGAVSVFDTNLGAAYAQSDRYDLDHLRQLPTNPSEAATEVRRLLGEGRVMIVTETHQYMNSELLMTPEEYERSTAANLRRQGIPLWQQTRHLRGQFPFQCFEHNRLLPETLQTLRTYEKVSDEMRIYDGTTLLKARASAQPQTVSLGSPSA